MSTYTHAAPPYYDVTIAFGAGADLEAGDVDATGQTFAAYTYPLPSGYQLQSASYTTKAVLKSDAGGGPAPDGGNLSIVGGLIQVGFPTDLNQADVASVGRVGAYPVDVDVSINSGGGALFTSGRLLVRLVFWRPS